MGRQKTQIGAKAIARMTGVIPYESDVQSSAFEYMQTLRLRNGRSLWDFAYAVPNGSMLAGNAEQRARVMNSMKKQGLKVGVSDIVIALPLGPYHGAYIEVKREKKSVTSLVQHDWLALMKSVGYFTALAIGTDEVLAAISLYWSFDRV